MFWSGNFMAVRELNFLLKEEHVTLESVLEADDILQECKADNKGLIQFLTRPDILAELITLITEEPPKNVKLSQQYRHASIACEVLTSHLSTLSERLSLDTTQMNRLCDFINKDPPLNPLLASYFSKTVEMLLERSPKQDWYLYHIVCLRVLDFFKSRRDFLPNLLRHISTSAIADTFKYFIRLEDLFNKPIMEWFEQHQFLDSLIAIICGTFVPEHFPPADEPEKGTLEPAEKDHCDNAQKLDNADSCAAAEGSSSSPNGNSAPAPAPGEHAALRAERAAAVAERTAAVAADNAAALLADLLATGCARDAGVSRSRSGFQLIRELGSGDTVGALLGAVFTSAPRRRPVALRHAARLLLQLHQHYVARLTSDRAELARGVELAVAPHLPLLHQALLHAARPEEGGEARRVGAARLATAELLAQLALSEVEEVASTLITLGTPALLVDMMFAFPDNNFLHAHVAAFCRHALSNRLYKQHYAAHLFEECDLLTRLMDAYEENENTLSGAARAGYMGHVLALLGWWVAATAAPPAPPAHAARLAALRAAGLDARLQRHDAPLGGSYPSDNMYEAGEEMENYSDTMAANYDEFGNKATVDMADLYTSEEFQMHGDAEHGDSAEFVADGLGLGEEEDAMAKAQKRFLELAGQIGSDGGFEVDMWEDMPSSAVAMQHDAVWGVPAWENSGGAAEGGAGAGAGAEADAGAGGGGGIDWARFDPFAIFPPDACLPRHQESGACDDVAGQLRGLQLADDGDAALAAMDGASLASNLLTALSGMTPAAIANLVNANLQPLQVTLPGEEPSAAPSSAPAAPAGPAAPASPEAPSRKHAPEEVPSPGPDEANLPDDVRGTDTDDSTAEVKLNCLVSDESSPEAEAPSAKVEPAVEAAEAAEAAEVAQVAQVEESER